MDIGQRWSDAAEIASDMDDARTTAHAPPDMPDG
jgi:hypothetical protein